MLCLGILDGEMVEIVVPLGRAVSCLFSVKVTFAKWLQSSAPNILAQPSFLHISKTLAKHPQHFFAPKSRITRCSRVDFIHGSLGLDERQVQDSLAHKLVF